MTLFQIKSNTPVAMATPLLNQGTAKGSSKSQLNACWEHLRFILPHTKWTTSTMRTMGIPGFDPKIKKNIRFQRLDKKEIILSEDHVTGVL